MKPLAREQHAGLRQLLVVLRHRGKDLLVREDAGFRVLTALTMIMNRILILLWSWSRDPGPHHGLHSGFAVR